MSDYGCGECDGTGMCPYCEGGVDDEEQPCDMCNGSNECSYCKGTGEVSREDAP